MKGDRNTARRLSARSLRWAALATVLVVAMAAIAAESARSGDQPRRIGTQSAAAVQSPRSKIIATAPNAQPPSCPAPPLPPHAHYPPVNNGYGIPFVAQLSDGELLSGYDQKIAAGGGNPWRAKISNITGWVRGLLHVPSLQATVNLVSFCNPGQLPPAGILIELRTPGTATVTNAGSCTNPLPGTSYQDDRVTLTPDPTRTTLAITGVEPDGSLDLTGKTEASTEIVFTSCSTPPQVQTCTQFGPSEIPLSSRLGPAPPGAPPGIVYPLTPVPLRGPINQSTATLAGNSFAVPAFKDSTQPGGCFVSILFNSTLAGFDKAERSRYRQGEPQPRIAGSPGWSEFRAKTQITQLAG